MYICTHTDMYMYSVTYIYTFLSHLDIFSLTCIWQLEIILGSWKPSDQTNWEMHSRRWRYGSEIFKHSSIKSAFQISFNSFNFHKDPALPVMINVLLSGGLLWDSCIFVWHFPSVNWKIRALLTDSDNVCCQLHSLFSVSLAGFNAEHSMCAEQMEEQTYLSGTVSSQGLAVFCGWCWAVMGAGVLKC